MRVGPSVLGRVKEMSVRPVDGAEMFCTIMSMLISASATARKMRGGLARLVGHADDGDLGLAAVVGDPGDDRLLHRVSFVGSVAVHRSVPSCLADERRAHVDGHVVAARVLHAAQVQHLGAGRRHLEHLLVGDASQPAGASGRSAGRR